MHAQAKRAVPHESAAVHLRVAAATHVGAVRTRNEDAFIVHDLVGGRTIPAPGGDLLYPEAAKAELVLAVADGLGGHANGAIASAVAAESVAGAMAALPPSAGAARVRRAVEHAHAAVSELAGPARGRSRMGTTLTAVHVAGTHAHVAHVGDSRAYLFRAGRLVALTRDHSFTQLLVDAGLLEEDARERSPYAGALLQMLGQERALAVDVATVELRDRDWLVLCSDGLIRHLADESIERLLRRSGTPATASRELIAETLRRGGEDNVTVVLASVSLETERASAPKSRRAAPSGARRVAPRRPA